MTMLKKITLLLVAFMSLATTITAQQGTKVAIVDTKYILDKMPEYKEAQKKLDQASEIWQKEIDLKNSEVEKMYRDYEAEKVMLSEDLKKKRQDLLYNKEVELRDLQKQRFGFEGDLFKRRQELVKPVQDKVYTAIQKLAQARGYELILDKSEGITVIFADPKLDKSDDILRELGIK